MDCSVEFSELEENQICSDHFHCRKRKIPRPKLKSFHIGHGTVYFLDQIGEIVERSPQLIFSFISDMIGGKMCGRHESCLYYPRCSTFPTQSHIDNAFLSFLNTYVFCSNCDNPQNMDLTYDLHMPNLKAFCRNRFCNAKYILPPFECFVTPEDVIDGPEDVIDGPTKIPPKKPTANTALQRAVRPAKALPEDQERKSDAGAETTRSLQGSSLLIRRGQLTEIAGHQSD